MEQFSCFKCGRQISGNVYSYIYHLRIIHGIDYEHQHKLICHQSGCMRTFPFLRSLISHIKRSHLDLVVKEYSAAAAVENELEDNLGDQWDRSEESEDMVSDCAAEEDECEDIDDFDYKKTFSAFLSRLVASSSMTKKNVDLVAGETSELLQSSINLLRKQTVKVLGEISPGLKEEDVKKIEEVFNCALDATNCMKSTSALTNYLSKEGFLIKEKEIELGTRFVSRRDKRSGEVRQVEVFDFSYYVPIAELIKKVLEEVDGFMEQTLSYSAQQNPELLDFKDGSYYKSHPLFSSGKICVPILFYYDDFEVSNPLGSHAGVHKLAGFYCIFKCVPPEFLSQLSRYFLIALCTSQNLKKYGCDAVLRQFVDDLKELEVTGIDVKTPMYEGKVYATLAQVTGDNLGLNGLFEYSKCFTSHYWCRFCTMHKEETRVACYDDSSQLRTKANFEEQSHMEAGAKGDCVLNELNYFHSTENFAPDIMHDVLEGIGPLEAKLVIRSLTKEGLFSLELLNSRIESMDYGFVDSGNKPSPLTEYELNNPDGAAGQKAAQSWCLLRFLPLLIGDKVPEGHRKWELLLKLLDCMSIIFSPSVSVDEVVYVKNIVADHHRYFLEQFPDRHLKPKHHLMTHYHRLILLIGPLIRYWAIRFEGKHLFFKRLSHIICNFKNIAYSLTYRHQMMLAYNFNSGCSLDDLAFAIGPGKTQPVQALEHHEAVSKAYNEINMQEVLFLPRWVNIQGTVYRKGMVLPIARDEDGEPIFGKILYITARETNIKAVFENWKTVYFDRHYHAYAVTNTQEVTAISFDRCLDFQPLHMVKSFAEDDAKFYIPTRFRI